MSTVSAPRIDQCRSAAGRKRYVVPSYLVAFLLFMVANMYSGHTAQLHVPIGPDRILLAVSMLLLVLDWRTRWTRFRFNAAHALALATVIWAAASAYVTGTLTSTLGGFALLDRLVIPYVAFALAPVIFPDAASRRILLKVLTVIGIYLGVTAIFEVVGPHGLVFPRFIMQPNLGISFGRARGPFLAADADGAVLTAAFFSSVANAALTASRRWRVVSAISCLLCLAGILLTLTRAVWLGAGVSIIVAALLHPRTRRALPIFAVVAILAVVGVLGSSNSLRAKVTDRTTTSRSVFDRLNTDAGGLRAIETRPLTGVGWTKFIDVSARYVRQARDYPLTSTDIEIHNVVLSRLAELGLIGGGLWILSVCLGPLTAVWSRRRLDAPENRWIWLATVGILGDWLVQIQFSPFPYPLPNTVMWLFAGLVVAMPDAGDSWQPNPAMLPDADSRSEPQRHA